MSTEEENAAIRVSVSQTSCFTRRRCGVCGSWDDKPDWLATYADDDGDEHVLCESCLAEGPEAMGARLRKQATEQLLWAEKVARELRRQAEKQWIWPTAAEWAACFAGPLYPGSPEWHAQRAEWAARQKDAAALGALARKEREEVLARLSPEERARIEFDEEIPF